MNGDGNTDNSPSSSYSSSFSPSTTIPACAACQYQRRRCSPNCTLAPYFPADNPSRFLNARRLFGISNMLKIIRHVHPRLRPDAMDSMIYESNMRANDLVGGCYRLVKELEMQCTCLAAELASLMQQLQTHRDQHQRTIPVPRNVEDDVDHGNDIENRDDRSNIHNQSNCNDKAAISNNTVGSINGNGNEVDNGSMLRLQHRHEVDVEPLIDYLYDKCLEDECGRVLGDGRDNIKDG